MIKMYLERGIVSATVYGRHTVRLKAMYAEMCPIKIVLIKDMEPPSARHHCAAGIDLNGF